MKNFQFRSSIPTKSLLYLSSSLIIFIIFQLNIIAQIIITEIMFDADTLENHNEFVEIYNLGQDTINLQNYLIGDEKELDVIINAGGGIKISPGQYGLILDASYFDNSQIYNDLIPPNALVLTIDDASFGNSGWSNSRAELVRLFDGNEKLIQNYRYSLDNAPGYSDEKILLKEDNSIINWQNSLVFRGTPGKVNSVTPLEVDGKIDSVWLDPIFPIENESFHIYLTIKNVGINVFNEYFIAIFYDLNKNHVMDSTEILYINTDREPLSMGDTKSLTHSLMGLNSGEYIIGIFLGIEGDLRPENNIKLINLVIESKEIPIRINEILFKPTAGEPEWVEICNCDDFPVNLWDWKFADSQDTVMISSTDFYIEEDQFIILSSDSTVYYNYGIDRELTLLIKNFPILNNEFDDLKLISRSGRVIDRVSYDKKWMRRNTPPGVSLERICPEISSSLASNWSASVDPSGSTPGRKNSIFLQEFSNESMLNIHPNPFSPDNDGFEDFTILEYSLPLSTGYITIDIFDITGRRVKRLVDEEPVAQKGTFIWDGKTKYEKVGKIGLYIVLFRVFEPNNNFFKEIKKTVVLMKR